ncbi:MAG: elongation factor P [Acidimicrobiia bacterium]|jgi:elongation factor P|nr:elongation factor P [Acidimicrobiia bacterium]
MISTNDVKPGMALSLDNGLFQIVEYQHVKPGKGKAFVRMKLKNVESGAVLDRTFRADEDVDRAIIEKKDHQYLYRDDLGFHFMDMETYSQFAVSGDLIADDQKFMTEGMTVVLVMHEGLPLGVDLPAAVELKVTEAEPAVKGDRVSGATKQVTVETGLLVQVPLFIDAGDVIKVDTRSSAYLTRA